MIIPVNKKTKIFWWQAQVLKKAKETNTLTYLCSRQVGKTWLGRAIIKDFMFNYNKRENPTAVIAMPYAHQVVRLYFNKIWEELQELDGKILFKQGSVSAGRVTLTIKRPWFGDVATVEFFGIQNPEAIRGTTADLLYIDEAAFIPELLYYDVLRPMTNFTDGKIILTSTVNGFNWFYNLVQDHKKHDNHTGAHIEFNAVTCQAKVKRWAFDTWNVYKRQGQEASFLREYMNAWAAAEYGEAPFASAINTVQVRGKSIHNSEALENSLNLFAVFDRGIPRNNAVWVGVEVRGVLNLFEYIDGLSTFDVITYLRKKYPKHILKLTFPHDINMQYTNDGKAEIEGVKDYIAKNGWDRQVKTFVLDKVKNKKDLVTKTARMLDNMNFHLEGTVEGRKKLTNVKHPKDAKGQIDYSKFARNDFQHAGDSLCHVAEAYDYGFTKTNFREINLGVEHLLSSVPSKYSANNFIREKRRR